MSKPTPDVQVDPPSYEKATGIPLSSLDQRPSSSHPHTPSVAEPPGYDDVTESSITDQLSAAGELITLVLDGKAIQPTDQRDNALYELNIDPLSGVRSVYSIEKISYGLSANDGQGRIRRRSKKIYEFYSTLGRIVMIVGKSGPKICFKQAEIVSASGRWNSCKVVDHFTAEISIKERLKGGNELEWKDARGKTVAIEYRAVDGGEPPRLEMKEQIHPKEFDLLIACWMGRVYRESCRLDNWTRWSSDWNKA